MIKKLKEKINDAIEKKKEQERKRKEFEKEMRNYCNLPKNIKKIK